jgi:hypothetical protein
MPGTPTDALLAGPAEATSVVDPLVSIPVPVAARSPAACAGATDVLIGETARVSVSLRDTRVSQPAVSRARQPIGTPRRSMLRRVMSGFPHLNL